MQIQPHTPFYHSPLTTFITDLDGKIMDANQSFFAATCLTRENLKNTVWSDLTMNAKNSVHLDLLKKLKRTLLVENIELIFCLPGLIPSQRLALVSARLVQLNQEPSIIFTINDISKFPHLTNDLCHMEDLKIASEMAAGVGHEIRNPMTSVRGFLQKLGQKDDLEKYQSYFQLMLEELDRANQIITEYLSLTKTKNNQITTDNLNAIITQIFPLLQISALSANQTILLDLAPIADFSVDAKEIRQLILNIVKNGLEAMDSGQNLTIKTYQHTPNSIILEIADQGHGIPDDIINRIGTPFFTTKETGTGLGLSICYTIAEKNNASIRIESSTNGTTFFLEFTKK